MKLFKRNIRDISYDEYSFMRYYVSNEKLEKIDKFRFYDDRLRSVCGYYTAVSALAEIEGIPQKEIIISYDENGKPYPLNSSARFSISHSEDMVVCAVSDREIGVDIEKIKKSRLIVAKRICDIDELIYIFGKEPQEEDFAIENRAVQQRFFEIWTKKEAFGKMKGFGINYDMKSHNVIDGENILFGDYVIAVCEENAGFTVPEKTDT